MAYTRTCRGGKHCIKPKECDRPSTRDGEHLRGPRRKGGRIEPPKRGKGGRGKRGRKDAKLNGTYAKS